MKNYGENVHKKDNCGPHCDSLVYFFKVIYIYIYIHIYVCIYTHTHTYIYIYFNYGSYLKIVCIRLVLLHMTL